jgi:hypothetical protein
MERVRDQRSVHPGDLLCRAQRYLGCGYGEIMALILVATQHGKSC